MAFFGLDTQNFWFAFSGMPGRSGPDLLNHFWSLAIEEQFYLVWPWVVALIGPRGIAFTAITGIMVSVGVPMDDPCLPVRVHLHFLSSGRLVVGCVGGVDAQVPVGDNPALLFPDRPGNHCGRHRVELLGEPHFADPLFSRYGIAIIAVMFAAWLLTVFRIAVSGVRSGDCSRTARSVGSDGIHTASMSTIWTLFVLLYPFGTRFLVDHGCTKSIAEMLFLVGYYLLVAGVSYLSYSWYERPFLRAKRFFEHARPTHVATRDIA